MKEYGKVTDPALFQEFDQILFEWLLGQCSILKNSEYLYSVIRTTIVATLQLLFVNETTSNEMVENHFVSIAKFWNFSASCVYIFNRILISN